MGCLNIKEVITLICSLYNDKVILPFPSGLGYKMAIKNKLGQIQQSLECPPNSILSLLHVRTSWLDEDRCFTGEVVSKGSSRTWELRHEESQEILGLRSEMLPHPKERWG